MPLKMKIPATQLADNGRAALYIRLTKEESRKAGLSEDAQEREGRECFARYGFSTLDVFREPRAVGGDVPFVNRLSGARLVAAIIAGAIGVVIVRDLDRLVRSMTEWSSFSAILSQHNVRLFTFGGELEIRTPEARLQCFILVSMANFEREKTAERIRRSKRQLAKLGRHLGGPPPYGYMTQAFCLSTLIEQGTDEEQAKVESALKYPIAKHLSVYEPEEVIVRLVFELYLQGKGCRAIARYLNGLGNRRRDGSLWMANKVWKVLTNPAVAGFISFDEDHYLRKSLSRAPKVEQALNPGKHVAIIEEAIWRQAQAVRATNTSFPRGSVGADNWNRRYPLSGTMLCGCGGKMVASSIDLRRGVGSYTCKKRLANGPNGVGGCDRPRISISKAHAAFWPALVELIQAPKLGMQLYQAAQQILQQRSRSQPKGTDVEVQLRQITREIAKMQERHLQATTDTAKDLAWDRIEELAKLKEQIEATQFATRAEPGVTLSSLTLKQINEFLAGLADRLSADNDASKRTVRVLIEQHGLQVRLEDSQTLRISLALTPPVGQVPNVQSHSVPVESIVELPLGKVDQWLRDNQDHCVCRVCRKAITIKRHHYWDGLPGVHRECGLAEASKARANPGSEFLNGMQAAATLGISRTTLGRWVKAKKLKPVKTQSDVLLFSKATITQLATLLKRGQR